MGATVGGDPASVGTGGAQLRTASRQVGVRSTGIVRAGSMGVSACGGSPVAAASSRFVAAYSQFATGLSTELNALGTLATNAADDLSVAGGGRPRAE